MPDLNRDSGEVPKDPQDISAPASSSPTISPTELIEGVSEDVAPIVGEFMEQAAAQNEAAADALPDADRRPASYISFERVSKSFGSFVVLKDVSFCANS